MGLHKYYRGVVIGKFYPPHKGHHYLIQAALNQCESVFVLVCENPNQNVPGENRVQCLREEHPSAEILLIPDNLDPDDTLGWAEYTIKILGFRPDVVFSSEDYGPSYAAAMGSYHVMVDKERLVYPCSGTKIRNNPRNFFDLLSPYMRGYYAIRVAVVGAESTGTTTLTKLLADYYHTNWVPEYGREYTEKKWMNGYTKVWTTDEFVHIAQEQNRLEDLAARSANKILFCDTDAFATGIWHLRYMKFRSEEIERIAARRRPDLYLVTGDEIPFVQDGSRDGEGIRHWMHEEFIRQLNETSRKYVILRGNQDDRMETAIHEIEARVLSIDTIKIPKNPHPF